MAIRAPKLTFEHVQQLGDRAAAQHLEYRGYLDAHPELHQVCYARPRSPHRPPRWTHFRAMIATRRLDH